MLWRTVEKQQSDIDTTEWPNANGIAVAYVASSSELVYKSTILKYPRNILTRQSALRYTNITAWLTYATYTDKQQFQTWSQVVARITDRTASLLQCCVSLSSVTYILWLNGASLIKSYYRYWLRAYSLGL